MGVFLVNPRYALHLWRQGLRSAADYLAVSGGTLVHRHRGRQVHYLGMSGVGCYLKRQAGITWKERIASQWAGFGWSSRSHREWQVLSELWQHGHLGPEPMAVGETPEGAFLLVRALPDAVDLPTLLRQGMAGPRRRELLQRTAHALAALHGLGLSHPDLFAKHVFVHWNHGHISFVDYQRTRKYSASIPWRQRSRDLAALAASLHPASVSGLERSLFLRHYLHAAKLKNTLGWRAAEAAVAARVRALSQRRKIQRLQAETAPRPSEHSEIQIHRVRPLPAALTTDLRTPLFSEVNG